MRRGLAVLLAAAALLAGCSSSGSPANPKPSELLGRQVAGRFDGVGLIPAQPRPAFVLHDTSGRRFAFGTVTAKHPTFLFFGYTHCPDECPATMADVRLALQDVPASVARRTYVVFVTTDVRRDTGPVLARWLRQFATGSRATWVGLRGTQAQIDAAEAAAHIAIATDHGEMHSAQALLYGPDDYARVAFLPTNGEAKHMAHDLPIVAGAGS